MKKISIAAAVLAAVVATPALADEGRVEARGGIVVRVPIEQGWSTTSILQKIQRTSQP